MMDHSYNNDPEVRSTRMAEEHCEEIEELQTQVKALQYQNKAMMASINFVKKREPGRVVVAIPTAPESSIQLISAQVDEILCLNIRRGFFFAVADAYHYWHDLSEEEVMKFLKQPRSP